MADKRDYYDILGVDKDADEGELKSAYRKLAMKFHPDRNPDDKEAEKNFKELNEAYEVLKDGEKRAAYDRFGPVHARGALKRAAVASTMKGVCIVLPMKKGGK